MGLIGLGLLVGGCGGSPAAQEVAESPRSVVGRIASVHAADGFALVQAFDDRRLPAGCLLIAVGEDGGSSSLRFTGERAGRYSAADLLSGTPQVGAAVVLSPQHADSRESVAAGQAGGVEGAAETPEPAAGTASF